MTRLARGSLPWPALPMSGPAKPVCRGSLTVEGAAGVWRPTEDHGLAALRVGRHALAINRTRALSEPWQKTPLRITRVRNGRQRRHSQGKADMTDRKLAALEILNGALWKIDTEDDPTVVVAALVEHAVAIATGEWEPERARTVVAELVEAAFVEEGAKLDRWSRGEVAESEICRLQDGRAVKTEEDLQQWRYEYLDQISQEWGSDGTTPIKVFPEMVRVMAEWVEATHGMYAESDLENVQALADAVSDLTGCLRKCLRAQGGGRDGR
jgi:hypothetical protein